MTVQASMSFGVNQYANFPDARLNGCKQDSEDMREKIFIEGLGLTWDQTAVLWDQDCTKLGMEAGLNLLTANADRLERAFFSTSGHGTPYLNPDEPDGQEGALVCHDLREYPNGDYDPSTLYLESEFVKALSVIPLSCLYESWIDVCYAGEYAETWRTIRSGKVRCFPPRRRIRPLLHRVMAERLGENTVIWAASRPEQTSSEGWFEGKSRGAFTYYFCREFRPDLSRGELLDRVRQALMINGYSQEPMLSCSDRLRALPVGVNI